VATAEVTGAFMTEDGRPVRTPEAFAARLSALLLPAAGATAAPAGDDAPSPGPRR
jgi:hypothetical protein